MSYGIAVYDASGNLVWNSDGILARVVATATVSFSAYDLGPTSVSVPEMLSTDEVMTHTQDSGLGLFPSATITWTTGTITVTRSAPGSGYTATICLMVLRRT